MQRNSPYFQGYWSLGVVELVPRPFLVFSSKAFRLELELLNPKPLLSS